MVVLQSILEGLRNMFLPYDILESIGTVLSCGYYEVAQILFWLTVDGCQLSVDGAAFTCYLHFLLDELIVIQR